MRPLEPDPGDADRSFAFGYRADAPGQPTRAIVEAMAWVTDVDPLELPPLYDAVDPERLEGVFGRPGSAVRYRSADGSDATDRGVSFEYEGHVVTVTADEIRIRPA